MDVLRVIEEEDLQTFSFEGLKRRTGIHPETLSRSLDRLEEQSMVERCTDGYKVTTKGREHLAVHPAGATVERLVLLRTMLPPRLSPELAFGLLKGKWFGSLRWLGCSQGDNGLVMKWVTADGSIQLDASLSPGELTVEGRFLQGGSLAGAITAAHELLAHISRLQGVRGDGRRLLFQVHPFYMTPN